MGSGIETHCCKQVVMSREKARELRGPGWNGFHDLHRIEGMAREERYRSDRQKG